MTSTDSTYAKPFLTIPERIRRLQERGMERGTNNTYASSVLARYGYSRLSGYAWAATASVSTASSKRVDLNRSPHGWLERRGQDVFDGDKFGDLGGDVFHGVLRRVQTIP